jgi:hypothetical protein
MDLAGKGHKFPTKRQRIQNDSAFSFKGPLEAWIAGWLFAWLLQADTITGAGPYTHTMKPVSTTNIALATTVHMIETADVLYKLPDMVIAKLTISGGSNGPCSSLSTWSAPVRRAPTARSARRPRCRRRACCSASDTDVLWGAPAGAVSKKERVKGWQVELSQALEVHRAPGGGFAGTMIKIGDVIAKLSLAVAAKDVDDIKTLADADTVQEVQINTNSGAAAQLNLKFPNIYFTMPQYSADGQFALMNIVSDQNDVLKSGASDIFTAVVINGQATAYLLP